MFRLFFPTLAAIALLALPAVAQEDLTSAPMIGASLTEKVWVESEEAAGRPGAMVLFLSEGTMLQTSCWEGYRLSSWYMESDTALSWNEDGQIISAEIVELNEAELILEMDLVGETVTRTFAPAPVPYVCPDMPR